MENGKGERTRKYADAKTMMIKSRIANEYRGNLEKGGFSRFPLLMRENKKKIALKRICEA